jgi:hypothetical protein
MSDAMSCRRAEELLSDHLEEGLSEPLRSELLEHLGTCESCAELSEALAEVVAALRSDPLVEPPVGLAARVAAAAIARGRARAPVASRLPWPASLAPLPIAAALAVALSAAFLLVAPQDDPFGDARRLAERTVLAREYLLEHKERLVEDIRLLRVVIATAFEVRLDRVNDRVEDYRRLLERKKNDAEADQQQRGADQQSSAVHAAEGGPSFENFVRTSLVGVCVSRERRT